MYSVEPKLKEIRDLHVDIWSRADELCSEYVQELGPSKVQEVEDKMAQQNVKINQHETEIRAKVLQLAFPPTPLTSYDQESLRIQKIAGDSQKRLMDMELEQSKRETKQGEVKVSSKADEFRDKVKTLEGFIKLAVVKDNGDYWKDADDDNISAAMKEIDKWGKAMAQAEDTFLEFDQLGLW